MKRILFQSGLLFLGGSLIAVGAEEIGVNQASVDLIKIFEVVIAGIVASAIVLSVLALFVGQWSGKRQNAAIKEIRKDSESDKESIEASLYIVDENVGESKRLLNSLSKKAEGITSKQHQAWVQVEDIEQMVEDAVDCSTELKETTDSVNQRMNQIQKYWDEQLKDTADVVQRVQHMLEDGMAKVELGLEELQENEIKSRILSQKVIEGYDQQARMLEKNASTSSDISDNLVQAFSESQQLIDQLNSHKSAAEKSFQNFSEELGGYESQAYDQFDTAFQATDIARQELDANVNESRHHVENLRRYESEGRDAKLKTGQYLKGLNKQQIGDFASTLENTQEMFSALQNDVQDAQYAIDSLRKMKHQISASTGDELAKSVDLEESLPLSNHAKTVREKNNHNQIAVNGESTLVPFFSPRK